MSLFRRRRRQGWRRWRRRNRSRSWKRFSGWWCCRSKRRFAWTSSLGCRYSVWKLRKLFMRGVLSLSILPSHTPTHTHVSHIIYLSPLSLSLHTISTVILFSLPLYLLAFPLSLSPSLQLSPDSSHLRVLLSNLLRRHYRRRRRHRHRLQRRRRRRRRRWREWQVVSIF